MTPLLAQRPRSDRGFERLYKRHVGDVYRYALAVMRNPTDAEDVTQTTFLNAYRAYVEKGSRPDKPQNWLIAIAHNVCRQRFRQTARRPSEVSFEDDIADTVADDDALSGEDIRRALGHLAFNQRAALVMRELEGRSYAEIAEILEVSTSAVETLIFRARRALREQLEGSLTCGEAEFAISRQLDGRLPRGERGQLRAHLRECSECAGFARRQRAQRGALKTLALVPVPSSLLSLFGGGGGSRGRNRSDAEGSSRADRRPGDRRSKLRRCAPRTVAGREPDGGCGAEPYRRNCSGARCRFRVARNLTGHARRWGSWSRGQDEERQTEEGQDPRPRIPVGIGTKEREPRFPRQGCGAVQPSPPCRRLPVCARQRGSSRRI